MNHRITIDRLFTLGQYKNMHVTVDSGEIEESDWVDPQFMNRVRQEMASEVMALFARMQLETADASSELKSEDWRAIYRRELGIRHNLSTVDLEGGE